MIRSSATRSGVLGLLVVAFVFSAALPRRKPAGATAAPIPMG
jgi:hypothetical protein